MNKWNAEFETMNGRAFAGRMGENDYLLADHECAECGLVQRLQVFFSDYTSYCGEGHETRLNRATVEAMRDAAIAKAKAEGLMLCF